MGPAPKPIVVKKKEDENKPKKKVTEKKIKVPYWPILPPCLFLPCLISQSDRI